MALDKKEQVVSVGAVLSPTQRRSPPLPLDHHLLHLDHGPPPSKDLSTRSKQVLVVDNSWVKLAERHRFLLFTMVILIVLCTVYLYFAVSMESVKGCEGMWGEQLELCKARLESNMEDEEV